MMYRVGPWTRAAVLVGLLAILIAAALLVPAPEREAVRAWIAALGPAAPVAFTLAYALTVPTPVPKSVLTAAAGVAFGIPLGAALVVVGGTLGAVLAFLIARWLGRDAVARLTRGRVARVDAYVERHGMLAALGVRMIPILPFTLLNYACGVTVMRLRHYVLGTALGIVPGSVLWVALGSVGARISPWLPGAISVSLALITLVVGAGVHRRRLGTRSAPDAA